MSGKMKILVLDDEPSITKIIGRLLTSHGYEVVELNDPLKLEEHLLYTNFNLLISDVRMPGLSGLDVLRLVKASKPDLPVVMLTGVTSIETAVEATKLGAAEYLTKPLDSGNILRVVDSHVSADAALPDGIKDFIESQLHTPDDALASEPDKILLKDEIVSTETIPDGLVEIDFKNIVPGQFLSFPLYIQIYNKSVKRYFLRKISQENTVFTSGLKDMLQRRNLGSVFIREQDYKDYLEYQQAIRNTPAFKVQQVGDSKRLLLYGKAVEAITGILTEPVDNENIRSAVGLVDDIFKTIVDDPNTYRDMFKLFRKDTYIFNHSANVCLLAVSFGVYLGMKQQAVTTLGLGAMFHDIGMNRVDRRILEKRSPLTKTEWEEIRNHPERGFSLVKASTSIPMPALRIILEHHERPDGTGYPRGVKSDKISPIVRVFQIIDKYDGMTTPRPYREAFSAPEALKRVFLEEPEEKYQNYIKRFTAFLGGK